MVRRGGMGYRNSAQKKRDRERAKSVRKQQSKGITDVNTDRYNNWGLPRGAKPPAGKEDKSVSKNAIQVKSAYIPLIIEHMGSYKSKSFGFTEKSFPVYSIRKRDGDWLLNAVTFRMDSVGFGDSVPDLFVNALSSFPDSDKPDHIPWGGPTLARFDTKKDAMDFIGASGSVGQSKSRYSESKDKVYVVQNRHLSDDHSQSYAIDNETRNDVYERNRDGVYRRVNESRCHGSDGIPETKL